MDAPTLLQLFLRPVVNLRAEWPTLTSRILPKKKMLFLFAVMIRSPPVMSRDSGSVIVIFKPDDHVIN